MQPAGRRLAGALGLGAGRGTGVRPDGWGDADGMRAGGCGGMRGDVCVCGGDAPLGRPSPGRGGGEGRGDGASGACTRPARALRGGVADRVREGGPVGEVHVVPAPARAGPRLGPAGEMRPRPRMPAPPHPPMRCPMAPCPLPPDPPCSSRPRSTKIHTRPHPPRHRACAVNGAACARGARAGRAILEPMCGPIAERRDATRRPPPYRTASYSVRPRSRLPSWASSDTHRIRCLGAGAGRQGGGRAGVRAGVCGGAGGPVGGAEDRDAVLRVASAPHPRCRAAAPPRGKGSGRHRAGGRGGVGERAGHGSPAPPPARLIVWAVNTVVRPVSRHPRAALGGLQLTTVDRLPGPRRIKRDRTTRAASSRPRPNETRRPT